MSTGSAGPSTIISPLFTICPSCAVISLSLGIKLSLVVPSSDVIINLCFPFVSLPKETVPVISARRPASLGDRASNNSATLGRPPVISLVLEASCGILAKTSPTATS